MSNVRQQVAADSAFDLSWFTDPHDELQLRRLTHEVDALAIRRGVGGAEFTQLLGIFERFPNDDGYESFWSIIHALESFQGYEPYLVRSVKAIPAHLSLAMVNRLLNAGTSEVEGQSLLELLKYVAGSPTFEAQASQEARDFLQYQEKAGRVA